MGKKQTLNGFNPDDFEVVDSANEFELVSAPKEAPKIHVSGYNQKTEEIISNIPDLSDGQKDVIRNLAKKGAKADVISNSILTLQGKHPIQSSIGKVEGNDDFRAFADIVTLGNANPKYYVEDDGTPVPLAKGVDAPKEKKVSNIWGSSGDTKDDSKLTTLAKNVWNIMPGVVENAADLIHLPYVLANTAFPQAEEWTDESGKVHNAREADWYKDFKSKIKTVQAETGEKYNAPIVKYENINKFTDLFDSKNYDINPDNVVGTIGSLVKSVGEFAVGGAGIGSVTNATTKGAKVASGFAASYMTQLGDVIDAAKESGLNTEDAYAFATAVTVPLALVDVNMGVEGRILSDAVAKGEKKALIKEIAKGVIKDADGKLTKEALDDAFKATLVANTALVKTWGKETVTDVLGEGGQEALQDFIQKSGEQLYDKLSGDPKFGTDAFSPESFGSYLNNAISGALGGMPTVAAYNKIKRIAKDNEQSKNAMGIISKGESAIKAFKVNVDEEVSKGFMTPEEGEIAKFKIDAYNEYNKQIGDLNIDQEEKRKVFDLSFQKQGLQTEVNGIDKDKLDPIELGKYEAKTKQIKDIQSEINDIITKSSVKDESVAGEKTIKDLSKPTKKEEEKVDLSPELQAINDRYKEETGFLPEKEVQRRLKEKEPLKMTEVKPTQFNEKRYNHREKFKQVAEHIDSTPEGRESGVLKVVDFTDPSGKKGKRIEVELPTGHRIWMSSSMAREGSDIMGHFREEHLPKNTSGKRAYEMMEGFPVKMKLVTTREGATGDNTAIKVYNAKTGKIIGWAKATTKGEDILTQPIISADEKFKGKPGITKTQYDAEVKRREDLAREEMIDRIEPVDGEDMGGQLTTTPITPKGPVKPPKQTAPKTKGEFVSSQIEKLKSEGDYDPSLQDFYEGHFGKQYDAKNTVPEKTEKPKKGPEQSKAQKLYYKIRSKIRDNFEKYISGKRADSPEETGVNSQEEYNDIVLRDSEVPSELAEAYLSAKNESVDDAEGTVEYAIYEFFANPKNTISEAHFAKYGDPNFANRKDLPAIRTYVSKDGAKIDQVAQEMSTNIGQEVQVQDIIDFILNNPTGIKDYENSMKVSQKRALAKKFRSITGETLNDVTAKAIVDEIYGEPVREMDKITDEEAQAELEARKKAQEENPDELLQKEKGAKNNKESIQKVIDVLKKSMPKVKVVVDENLTDKNGNPVAGKWDPKTNTVSVNPNYADTDTPIHEYGHVLIDAIGRDNKVIKAAIKQLEGTKLWKKTKQRYPDLNESNLGVEVLAEAIGREGQGIFDTVAEQSRFKTFLDYIFDWLKTKLGLNKNIAKSLAKQIITGRGTKDMEGFSKEDEFQIVGEKAKLSKQIMEGLKSAKNMESMEYSPEEIRLATGWEKAKDGKWRYEIGDESAQFSDIDGLISSALKITDKDGIFNLGNLNDVFEYNDLYEAYPELKNIKFNIYNGKGFENGYFDPKGGSININVRSLRSGNYGSSVESIKEQSGNLSKLRGAIIHEAQHATQRIENFNSGGSKESAERYLLEKKGLNKDDYSEKEWNDLINDTYSNFAGEVEANNAVFRSYLKDSEKKDFSLESTEDVDRAVQILFDVNEQYQRPKYKRAEGQEVMSLNDFRETELNRDVEKEKDDINYVNEIIKDKSSSDKERKDALGLRNHILNRQRMDKKEYLLYKTTVQSAEDILEDDGLEDYSVDDLIDTYWNASSYMDNESDLFKKVKYRIAVHLRNEQIKFLEGKNSKFKKEDVGTKDLTKREMWMKSLDDIDQFFPESQNLSKALNNAFLEKAKEVRELSEELNKRAKAVIKERNKILGITKGWIADKFSSTQAKYFKFLDAGDGKLISNTNGLTPAQKSYYEYFKKINDLMLAKYDENDNLIDNSIMKMDRGFFENLGEEGENFFTSIANYLLRGVDAQEYYQNLDSTKEGLSDAYVKARAVLKSKDSSFKQKVKALNELNGMAKEIKKAQPKGVFDYQGPLTMRFDHPRLKDDAYSKDFHKAALSLISDYAHVKHIGALIPLFDAVTMFHSKGIADTAKWPNIAKFIKDEMQDKIYQTQSSYSWGKPIDFLLNTARKLTALSVMGFSWDANMINLAIGKLNDWITQGLPSVIKGNGRFFVSDWKKGEDKLSNKAIETIKRFDIVKFDAESNPEIKAASWISKFAYFLNKMFEYNIQGAMFLGHLSQKEWDSLYLDNEGKIQIKGMSEEQKAFEEKMDSYKSKTSSIQGKYDEKDRRMFMRGAAGKAAAQFKVWIPDWWKSRFGEEFINKYGETGQGRVRKTANDVWEIAKAGVTQSISESIRKIRNAEWVENTEGVRFAGTKVKIPFSGYKLKDKALAQNIREAVAIAGIYIWIHSGDDDDKKKKKQFYQTLSLENTLGNLLAFYDPDQAIYLMKNLVAIQGTLIKFLEALNAVIHGDFETAGRKAKKLTPYGKGIYPTAEKLGIIDKKK